jgi:ubiquinol oxidase
MYLLSPSTCHRFVGYLEEEAVHTYTVLLEQIDKGNLPHWSNLPAPQEAREYYHLPTDAKFRDMILAIRADEACHREVNHHFADIPTWQSVPSHEVNLSSEQPHLTNDQKQIEPVKATS